MSGNRGSILPVRSWTVTASAVLLVAGGVAYADWILQLFLPVQADLTSSFVSELSAAGQPFDSLFRIADVVGGALLVAGGTAAWLCARRWPGIWITLVLLGACIVIEATLPLNGTFTFAAILPRAGTALWWQRVSEPHGVVSFAETVCFLVLFRNCTVALRRSSAPLDWQRLVAVVGLAAVLCGVLDAALTAALLMGGQADALGLVQRLGVTLTAVWLAAAPTGLLVANPRRTVRSEQEQTSRVAVRS